MMDSVKIRRCIFCDEPILGKTRTIMHRECVIDDIYETLASGNKLTLEQKCRARNKNVSVMEIRETVIEDMSRGKLR